MVVLCLVSRNLLIKKKLIENILYILELLKIVECDILKIESIVLIS